MTDRDTRKAEVLAVLQAASPPPARAPRARKKPASAGNTIIVNGDGVAAHQIAGGDIHNHSYAKAPPRPRVVVTPGVGVIDEAQKVALTALRAEWLTLHAAIKRRPLSYGAAWTLINKAAGATSYHLITPERFPLAVAFVKQQMARLRAMASAPARDKGWRASQIGKIKARCANQLRDPEAYKRYIAKNFQATSLTDLDDAQLRRTAVYIYAKKPPA